MKLRERLRHLALARDLRVARRRFRKATAIAEKLRFTKLERRAMMKDFIRSNGYKHIRISESPITKIFGIYKF